MPIRVLQFADIVNRYDFIDTIVQFANRERFEVGLCVRTSEWNIVQPLYRPETPRWVLDGASRSEVPRAALQLARIMAEWRADIVHAHHYDQAVIAWLATRLYRKARLFVGRHYSNSIYRSSRGRKQKALLAIEGAFNRAACRIVVPSRFIEQILTEWQGVSADKVVRIPYGFVEEKYAAPEPAYVEELRRDFALDGEFTIASFGRLHEEKGHRYLLEAMSCLRESATRIKLLLVGEGAERPRLERQVERLGLRDRVLFTGWRTDSMAIMAAVDAVVQPTLQEAFSQVMAESLWMARPLVMTDVSGATDILCDGENGILVPKADASALADAVLRLARSPELCKRLADSGKTYVTEQLAVNRIMPRYESAYLAALGQGSA